MFYEKPNMELLAAEEDEDIITASGLFEEDDEETDGEWSDWW